MVSLLLNHENRFQYLINRLIWWLTDSWWITHTLGVKDDCGPDSDIWNGNQGEEIACNPNSDHQSAVYCKAKSPVCDFLRLALTIVANNTSSSCAFCVHLARDLSYFLR